jgi:hypothetical protein
MPITTSASIAQAKSILLANSLLRPLVASNILMSFLKSDSEFAGDTGSYKKGATLSIAITPTPTTSILTATGGAITYPKQILTSVTLTLDSIAVTSFGINGADTSLANIDPESAQVLTTAESHGSAIEAKMMLDTFNNTAIDVNATGTLGTPANYKLLRTLWSKFQKAKAPNGVRKLVILPPDMYAELQDDNKVARTVATNDGSQTVINGILDKTLNFEIYSSVMLPTSDALTNLTGTGVNQLGFALTVDSIVAAVRELPVNGDGLGVRQVIARSDEYNIATRVTESYNPAVAGGDKNFQMETLFGTMIYRPTTVFPIFGGVA